MRRNNFIAYFFIPVILSFVSSTGIFAQNILEIKVDTLENHGEIIYYCPAYDSIHLIGAEGSIEPYWSFSLDDFPFRDTAYSNEIYLPNGYKDDIFYGDVPDAPENYKNFRLIPVNMDSTEKNLSVACNSDINLSAESSFLTSGNISYTWSPETGLSSTNTKNTLAHIENDIKYTAILTSDNGCSEKRVFNIKLDSVPKPEICLVGLNDDNKNVIYFDPTPAPSIDSVYLLKETVVSGVYEKIASLKAGSSGEFVDEESFPDIQSNKYKMQVLDGCDRLSEMSEVHKTIHLAINQGQGNTWNLIWQPYEGIEVSTYYIYRGTDPDSMELIGSSSSSNTQYSDFSAPDEYVYYQIAIFGPADCGTGKKSLHSDEFLVSKSNLATNNPHPISVKESDESSIKVFPNPAGDFIQLEMLSSSSNVQEVQIYDISGKKVLSEICNSATSSLDVSQLDTGMYILHLRTSDGGIYFRRFSKR